MFKKPPYVEWYVITNKFVMRKLNRVPSQENEPKPQEDVDLLVDDVDGEDAEAVEHLDSPSGTEPLEGTFGHLGKGGRQRFDSYCHIAAI